MGKSEREAYAVVCVAIVILGALLVLSTVAAWGKINDLEATIANLQAQVDEQAATIHYVLAGDEIVLKILSEHLGLPSPAGEP